MEPFGCTDVAWRNGESARGAQAQEEQEQPPRSPSTGGNPKSWKQRVTLPQARCSQALPRSPFSSAQHRWAGDKASQHASTGVSNTLLLSFKLHLLSSPHTSAGTGHPKQLNPTYFYFFFLPLLLQVELSCVGQGLWVLDWISSHIHFPLRTKPQPPLLPQKQLATSSTNTNLKQFKGKPASCRIFENKRALASQRAF